MGEIDVSSVANLFTPPLSLTSLRLVNGGPWAEGDHYWEGSIGGIDLQLVRGIYTQVETVGPGWGHNIGYRDYFGTFTFDEYVPWLYQIVAFGRNQQGIVLPIQITNVPFKSWITPLVYADLAAVALHCEPTVSVQLAAIVVSGSP